MKRDETEEILSWLTGVLLEAVAGLLMLVALAQVLMALK